jgi:hypothetical protein
LTAGPVLFARYAHPPHALGYCGPGLPTEMLAQAAYVDATGGDDRGLRQLATGFEGAWPYLQLIAAANGLPDPLDPRVVAAYWVGNGLLDRVGPALLFDSMESRFRSRAGDSWWKLGEVMSTEAVPHHNFHVFAVYPWVGLLRSGRLVDEPLRVLDRCRIRWGQVTEVEDARVRVVTRLLAYDGHHLTLGEPVAEAAARHPDGIGPHLRVGDWVSLHWDWVCDRLESRDLAALQRYTVRTLRVANAPAHPAPGAVLG